MLPHFSRLLPPPFSDLRGQLKEVQLSSSMLISATAEISELSFKFQSIVKQFGSSDHQNELVNILCKLWDRIVDPVVQALTSQKLAITRVSDGCPAAEFTLLPLHAAGTLREKEKPQIYFSSYTPTLANLIRARQQVSLVYLPPIHRQGKRTDEEGLGEGGEGNAQEDRNGGGEGKAGGGEEMWRRRHHRRLCGRVVCAECSGRTFYSIACSLVSKRWYILATDIL
ncbi:hypothetical protein C8R48DRAFT_836925 [Suillus tomentosus]|nr:hypothetical protein C8R48DRAFT_836925 [Suillus tomentosus]